MARVKNLFSAVGIGLGFVILMVSTLDVMAQSWTYDSINHVIDLNYAGGNCTITSTITARQLYDSVPDSTYFVIKPYLDGSPGGTSGTTPNGSGMFTKYTVWVVGGACGSGTVAWYNDTQSVLIDSEAFPQVTPTPTAIPDPTQTPIPSYTLPPSRVTGLVAIPTAIPIPTIPPTLTLLETDEFWNLENYESMISITQSMFNFAFFNDAWEIAGFLLMAYLGIRLIINFASRGNEALKSRRREEV